MFWDWPLVALNPAVFCGFYEYENLRDFVFCFDLYFRQV